MSLFVILALELEPTTNEINSVPFEPGFELVLVEGVVLKEQSGFLPAQFNQEPLGFELYSFPVASEDAAFQQIVPEAYREGMVYQLRFGTQPGEAQAAFTMAAKMNIKYNGITIEDQVGMVLTVQQLKAGAAAFSFME